MMVTNSFVTTVMVVLLTIVTFSSHALFCSAFYLPGVNPQSFQEGDHVKLKVNKMTSTKTLLPVDYYRLPFCHPINGPTMDNENLGEFLSGDRIESSPYQLIMKKDVYCQQLCISNLGRMESSETTPNRFVKAIRQEYHNNWIVDNLSSASKTEDDATITTRYWQGFPIGFIHDATHQAYVHNHVNIEIMYHPVEGEPDRYRIVRFTVEPFSIKHEFEPVDDEADTDATINDDGTRNFANIVNPITSCNRNYTSGVGPIHTNYEMVTEIGREPQLASGQVLWTYDVRWERNDELHWANRWDIYLTMDYAIPARVHWMSLLNSLIIVMFLSASIILVLIRNLKRDLAMYNRVATDEENIEDLEEKGWKLIHADVFRPPSFSPMLLSACCGTGAQLLGATFWTIVLCALGFFNPARRGSLVMGGIMLYVLNGPFAGYVTARLYKTFQGEDRQTATLFTAFGFPGLGFILFFVSDIIFWTQRSTYAVPFMTIVVLLFLWFAISTPLIWLGAYIGYWQSEIEYPVKTSAIEREIPTEQPWYTNAPLMFMVGGIIPFGACFNEMYFIMASVWLEQYYYVFGFLFLILLVVIVTVAEISILCTYFQVCSENYHWWWRSFFNTGTTALYMFLYSIYYLNQMGHEHIGTVGLMFYIIYMFYVCLAVVFIVGFIGLISSLWFNIMIFGSLKTD